MTEDLHPRVTNLEDEMKELKKEIKEILFDIREQHLNTENPFTIAALTSGDSKSITWTEASSSRSPKEEPL